MDIKAHQFDPDKKYDEEFGAWCHGPGAFFAATPNRGHVPVGKTDWILNFSWPGAQNEGERFERIVVSDALYQAFFAEHVSRPETQPELPPPPPPEPEAKPSVEEKDGFIRGDRWSKEVSGGAPVKDAEFAEVEEAPVEEKEPEKPFAELHEVLPPAEEPTLQEINDSPAKGKSRKAHGVAGKDSKSGK